MDELTWIFANGSLGVRAAAAGFTAFGQGVGVDVVSTFTADDLAIGPDVYEYTEEIEPESRTIAGMVIVHLALSASVALDPANLSGTYGGLELTFEGGIVEETTLDVIQAIGYAYIGDSSELANNDLVVALSGVSAPNVVAGSIEVSFVNGLADAAPEFFEAGTVDTYATTLTIDPEPTDDDDVFVFVFTGAVQAEAGGDGTLSLNGTGYEQIGSTLGSANALSAIGSFACDVSYNCDCDVDPDARTLEQMRIDTLSVSGYAAQATNPPPGIARMYNNFIDLAQKHVYSKCRAMNTSRFFTWKLIPGVRYYGLADMTNCCTVQLNRYRIEGAWIQNLNNVWWPLVYGIDPTGYTLDQNFGWPTNFEVRQCIEVFPAPQQAYTLRVKGHFQLLPLTDDEDTTTIPSTPVLNWAIFLAKSHRGMKDATIYSGMASAQIDDLIAGRHVTKRYIPGTAAIPVPTPPIMVRFDN